MLHSSLRRFSMGVPVSAMRCAALTAFTARAALVAWFLMYWASSITWNENSRWAIPSISTRRVS